MPTPVPPSSSEAPHLAAPDVNPSFTKGLFLGEVRESLVFPFPALSSEESESLQLILDTLHEFAATAVDSHAMDQAGAFPDDMRARFHDLGLMGLNIPEAYGGYNASTRTFSRIFGALGAIDPALTVYFGAHASIGCKGIILFGTEAQRQQWLPACATGETVAAFCLTEPGSGSDAQAMASTAVLNAEGTHYVLNGSKIWISNAGYAGLFTVFAKVPVTKNGSTKQSVTAFIVDAHSPGIHLGHAEHKMGIRASDTRTVTFDNVQVPIANVLGEVGHGFRIALEILNSGRLGLAAASAQGARRSMNTAIAYAKQRHQFGQPLSTFEMIQQKIARAAANIYAADSAAMLTAGLVDRGGIDFSLETAICKVFASEVAVETASDAMQIAGGIGYSEEYPYAQGMRDARINMIFEGTNEILRALIALSGLQQPGERLKRMGTAFKDPLHSLGAIGSFLANYTRRTVTLPDFSAVHPALHDEAHRVATLVRRFARAVDRALVKYGTRIMEKQFLQERMANTVIDLYVSTAVLSRTTWEIERRGGETEAATEVEYARAFLNEAYRRARRHIVQLSKNQDRRLKGVVAWALDRGDVAPPAPWEHR